MSKSLVVILHYNTTHYTDALYEMLKPYESNVYDLMVFDNGSDPGKESKYNTYKMEENCYYGGGLDVSIQFFLENTQYDSFTLLNSDLIVHGYNFIQRLRDTLFSDDKLMIASPCVIQPSLAQCYWKQMHCWNAREVRIVPFVDYQCALMKREFADHVKAFGSRYGWVQDLMTGIICRRQGWKIGVCDWIPIVHIGNGTVKETPQLSNYNVLAQQEMDEYFHTKQLVAEAEALKSESIRYCYGHVGPIL